MSNPQQEGPVLELFGEDCLDVVRVLSHDEISKCEVTEHKLILPYKFLQFVQLSTVLLKYLSLGSFVVLVEEKALDSSGDFEVDGEEALNLGVVMDVFAEQFALAPSLDDVALDGPRFSDVEITVQKVGQVGEVESKVHLIVSEPFFSVRVMIIFKFHARIGEEESGDLSKSTDAPVSELNAVNLGGERSMWRKEGALDGIGALIVGLNFWKSLEVMPDAPPESVIALLTRVKCLEVVKVLCQQEVHKCEVAQCPLTFANEVADGIQLRSCLLKKINFKVLVVLVPEKSLDVLEGVSEHAHDVVDVSSILRVLAQQVSLARSADDVLSNGSRLCEFEISVNEIGKVREFEAKIDLILIEPFLARFILDLFEGEASVGEEKTQILSEATYLPITEDQVAHQDIMIKISTSQLQLLIRNIKYLKMYDRAKRTQQIILKTRAMIEQKNEKHLLSILYQMVYYNEWDIMR